MTDELDKVATPRGDGRSMQALTPNNVAPGTGADWFGPAQPMKPVAPPEVAGRTWDFPAGYNLATEPRAYEQVSFPMLRALAESYDPVRLIIERRKDQMCRLPWTLRYRHEKKAKRLSAQQRNTLREIEDFIQHPCAEYSFRSWLRVLLEDLLVIDAPAIHCVRDSYGDIAELVPLDGSIVGRILDEHGRPPRPLHWNGQPFNWLGRTVTGADLDVIGAKIVGGMVYLPQFQISYKGLPAWGATEWDLVYAPNNPRAGKPFGFSPVEQIITTVSTAMRRQISQLEYLREGNTPEGVFGLPEGWTVDQVTQFEDSWNNMLAGNLARRRQIRFVAGDGKFTPFKEPPLKAEFDEWLVRIACAAFSYPPSAFVSLSNRSIAEQHEKQAEQEGLDPLKQWVCEVLNGVLDREFPGEDIEFIFQESEEVDPVRESAVLTRYVDAGVISRNEARDRIGLDRDPSPNSDRLMVKTSSGFMRIDSDPPAGAGDDGNTAEKLAKGMIIMLAPSDCVPSQLSLDGIVSVLDVTKRERRVFTEADALVLEAAGWRRKPV
jgi:hypothetical protein